MKRKIKFPLIMKDGVEVRTIEGLRGSFDLESIINYYLEGKLQRWLKDRNHENELNQILDLDKNSINLNEELCSIFDVAYEECAMDIDIEKKIEDNSKINKLKQYTDDEHWIEKIDHIMFDQDDLDNRIILVNQYNDLSLEEKTKTCIFENYHSQLFKDSRYRMYLCGDKFDVNNKCENVEYVGVNNPHVNISINDEVFDADEKNILFSNVRISSSKNILLKLKKIDECNIDNRSIELKSKIDVKYNKTIIRDRMGMSLIILDEDGKIHFLGSFVNGEKWVPKNLPKIVDIDSSLSIVLALDENGKVHQWGNLSYQFGRVPNDLPKIKQVTVNHSLAVALGENGKVYYWGGIYSNYIFNGYEQSGRIQYKKMPNIASKIIQIANEGDVVLALDENGKVYSWGEVNSKLHNIPSNLPPLKKIVTDSVYVLALDENGKIHHWGMNEYGVGEIPKNLPTIVDISCENKEYAALDENGKIHIWGENSKAYNSEVHKLNKLRSIYGYSGVDENGKIHGRLRYQSVLGLVLKEYTELDNIKIMNPIR